MFMHLRLCILSISVVLCLVLSNNTSSCKLFLSCSSLFSTSFVWFPNVCIYQPRSLTTSLHHPLRPLLFTLGSVVRLPSRSPGSVADYADDDDDGIFCMECSLTVMQKSIFSSSTPALPHWPPPSATLTVSCGPGLGPDCTGLCACVDARCSRGGVGGFPVCMLWYLPLLWADLPLSSEN